MAAGDGTASLLGDEEIELSFQAAEAEAEGDFGAKLHDLWGSWCAAAHSGTGDLVETVRSQQMEIGRLQAAQPMAK